MRAWLAPLAIAFVIVALPDPVHACEDGGPRNFSCAGDAGPVWIRCAQHEDCPEGQVCDESGSCGCGCSFGEQSCDEQGCRCCGYAAETTCFVAFECAPRDAGIDAGIDAGSPTRSDGGIDAGEPADAGAACSVSPGHGSGSGAIPGALALLAALWVHRRSHRRGRASPAASHRCGRASPAAPR